jgi:hypothetical protein
MTDAENKRIAASLLGEYQKTAVRKVYKGTSPAINGCEGFAWKSQVMKRWCFLPIRTELTVDNVFLIDPKNLFNL